MKEMNLHLYKHVHFVGIGGVGMRALANILLAKGVRVSGSDREDDTAFEKFKALGAQIFIGHAAEHINGADLVVVSTAIPADNPEVLAAREKGIPIVHRSDIVTALMNDGEGIAVAGAHGKTTTTSMIGCVFETAGNDSTIIIGGEVDYLHGNSRYGKGRYVLAEADESDGSFLKLHPHIAVITNIEDDHLDHYGSVEAIKKAFIDFVHNLDSNMGLAVVCAENPTIRGLLQTWERPFVTYGFGEDADYWARNLRYVKGKLHFEVLHRDSLLGEISLLVPGKYNVLNALATIAVCLAVGIPFTTIAKGLANFLGAKRRFQTIGRYKGIWIVDDYAHHPTEISATLEAAKEVKAKRVICAFQPHRYTRTDLLRDEFALAFSAADIVIFMDIYSAGEKPIEGVTGELLPSLVKAHAKEVHYLAAKDELPSYLATICRPGDLVITMGAGDVCEYGPLLLEELKKRN